MPEVPILMPQLGESIAEAKVVRLLVSQGDRVVSDQEVIEVETNKATMGVTTLCSGVISRVMAEEEVSYAVGTILGYLEVTEEEIIRTGVGDHLSRPKNSDESASDTSAASDSNVHFATDSEYVEPTAIEPHVQGLPVPAGNSAQYISPRLRARMNELGLQGADISAIAGSGAGGRVTIEDLEYFLEYISEWPSTKASPMRMAVADAMRRSWTRPLATVGLPVYIDRLLDYRKQQMPKPSLTLYVLKAFTTALQENPESAGFLIGDKIVHPRAYDIGVAVQVDDGVLVPVIRNVNEKSIADLLDEYVALVDKARTRRVTSDLTQGGIATVTNFGTFGLKWGTPIPLPNETLILGMGAGTKQLIWSEEVESFLPVTEMDLVLTFDHRVVDGGGAGMLLNRVAELLQRPQDL